MSNRVYLYCTDFNGMPKANQWDDFFRSSGIEYEATGCIPIYWLCLFEPDDIKVLPTNYNGFDDDERAYPYLQCKRSEGVLRLRERAQYVEKAVGENRFTLYQEWIERVESEQLENIIVRTEQLDWMCGEGELERDLRKAFKHMKQTLKEGELRMSNAMNDIAGLWSGEILAECESYELVGTSNTKDSWPKRYTPPYSPPAAAKIQNKWWKFW